MVERYRQYTRRQAVIAGLTALGGLGIAGGLDAGQSLASGVAAREHGLAGHAAPRPRLAAATRDFGFRLLDRLVARQPGENVFISPSSVAMALAMTYNGAVGATQQTMATTLGLRGMGAREVNQAYALLAATLHGLDPHVELAIANSLWSRRGLTFDPAFVATLRQYYGAEATTLDFADPHASLAINGWVAHETRGKIARIVPDRIDPGIILYLINAIYFKGRWSVPFDKGATRERPFTGPDSRQKTLPMMTRTSLFPYYQGTGFQGVSLPYGAGKWSMVVLLPDKGAGLAGLHARLAAGAWDSWLAQFSPTQGTIVLPRFKVSYAHNLNDALEALGMGAAFSGGADFSHMIAGRHVAISAVDHAAIVEVDEEGITAAAATSVGMTTAARVEGFTMVVDRPFLCAIRDHTTGTVLFAGSIVDPIAMSG